MNAMNKALASAILGSMLFLFCSCGDNNGKGNAAVNNTDTLPRPKWDDPRKGKIFGKVNVMQIPLTAYEQHILGQVRSVRYVDYEISAKDSTRTLVDSGYNVYDRAGHLIDQNEYKADGTAKWHCTYTYDEHNKAVSRVFNYSDPKQNSKTTFKYDGQGRMTEEMYDCADKKKSMRSVFKYDERGNQTEETTYFGDTDFVWIEKYTYDSRNYQVAYEHRDETGRIIDKRTHEYDNRGRQTGGTSYETDTMIRGKWRVGYDDKNKTLEYVAYDKEGKKVMTYKMKYDEWENLIEFIICYADGSINNEASDFESHEYDAKGNIIKQTNYKIKDGKRIAKSVTETTYTYY